MLSARAGHLSRSRNMGTLTFWLQCANALHPDHGLAARLASCNFALATESLSTGTSTLSQVGMFSCWERLLCYGWCLQFLS